jgi:hypothetical protein
MPDNENARPGGGTSERAEWSACGAASIQTNYSTTAARSQCNISDFLGVGRENAVSGSELADRLHVHDLRFVTRRIEQERRAGSPICATTSGEQRGYFLAASPDELRRYTRSLDRRLLEVQRTRQSLEDILAEMTGQLSLGGNTW